MAETLERRAESRALVTIFRNLDDVENLEAYVVGVGSELVLLHVVEDFHLDGYCILPRAHVERARHSSLERYRGAILRAEKVRTQVGFDGEIDLDGWNGAFKSLKTLGEPIIVEDEREGSEEFVIGRIERVNKKSASIRGFDPIGRWYDDPTRFKYEDVTSLVFGSEYVTIYSKYLLDT